MEIGELNHSISEKLKIARKELLDLGFRNRLINFKKLKSSGVQIKDELSEELYRALVADGREMQFFADLSEELLNSDIEQTITDDLDYSESISNKSESDRQNDNKVQTSHNPKNLHRRLLNTYYTARTHIQERGVNVLYMALGILYWYEDENSEVLRRSPLILIPIELSRSDAHSKFKVKYTGDDVGGNLSLQAKLKMDFSLDIPIPDETDEIDISNYFQSVRHKIRNQRRWKIEENEQGIGFFSYNKFLMYNDLNEDNWPDGFKPSEHPIMQSLLETGFTDSDPNLSITDHLDDFLDPKDLNQVVDADSSQILAIEDVKNESNLIIQGPPGTGKSQTITNIIAEALAMDKSVLFVSEKMAALEVVKRRLDNVGLGMACLELHSHKTNKKSFLNELEKTLNLEKPISVNNVDVETLKKNREELNQYSTVVNKVMGISDVTPYQAYGKILNIRSKLGSISTPRIDKNKLLSLDKATFRKRLDLIDKLEVQIKRIGRPAEHPFWGSNLTVHVPFRNDEIKASIEAVLDQLEVIQDLQNDLTEYFELDLAECWQSGKVLLEISKIALDVPMNIDRIDILNTAWLEKQKEISHYLSAGLRISELKSEYGADIINEAWNDEVLEIRKSLVAKGDRWWRFFSKDYWSAKNALAGLMVESLPKELEAQLDLVGAILEYQRLKPILEEHDDLVNEIYRDLHKSENSDWENLHKINAWLINAHAKVKEEQIPSEILSYFKKPFDMKEVQIKSEKFKNVTQKYFNDIQYLFGILEFDDTKRFEDAGFWQQPYLIHTDILESQFDNVEKLGEISSLNNSFVELREEGWEEIETIASEWKPAGSHLSNLFELNWLEAHLEKAIQENDELSGFNSEVHWSKIKKFRDLDLQLMKQRRAELAYKHWSNLPSSNGRGEVRLLKKEMNKKSRHLPIRQLIAKSGNAIKAIKPIFMMSPLSVSTYLPPGAIEFDLVVFDEASQVRPVDAFSPLLRGKQAVVVGDSKQLPPTSFFNVELELEDEEEQSELADMDSILGSFESMGAPSRMLRWHYRSEHESLIAVSNYEFYDNKLVLFPSPDVEKKNSGIKYHHLPHTHYEPGRGKSYNRLEAKHVAEAVLQHAKKNPELSLGVAAFSKSQMSVIQDELEILRRNDASYESFFNSHPEEPFFVKNLENVQGDERDIIFISVGYGKTKENYVAMNFGPMNKNGGERRLNVLITRARKRCEIFTNLLPQDIDTNRTQAKGMVSLKRYLKYARTGILDIPESTGREADSLFEEDVAHEIRRHGYEVEHQVGSGGFYIDLGVVHPDNKSDFILGIECDGASYHSARSARDRDRIRQNVLENIGWNIYRIWSTDWFLNKEKEVAKVVQKIEWMLINKNNGVEIEKEDTLNESQNPSFHRIADENKPEQSLSVPYEVKNNLNSSSYSAITVVEELSQSESPIHEDLLIKKTADFLGYGKVGSKIKFRILNAIKRNEQKNKIIVEDGFVYHNSSEIKVRDRSNVAAEYRDIDYIAPEEIKLAIEKLIKISFSIEIDDLIKQAGVTLGFKRVTQKVYRVIENNLQGLIDDNKVSVNDSIASFSNGEG